MIRLLAIDIDGTLLDGRGRLPDDAPRRARRGVRARHRGRARDRPQLSFHRRRSSTWLPIPLTLIVNNGAVVKRKTGDDGVAPRARSGGGAARPRRNAHLEDSVAIVFDRPGGAPDRLRADGLDAPEPARLLREEQGLHRRGARRRSPTRLAEDPIQVMFNGSVEPMRALVATLRAMPVADRFSRRDHRVRAARFLAGRRQRRRLLEGDDAGAMGDDARAERATR